MADRLSLVIPAYNEEPGIRQAVAEADAALAGLGLDYEVLVVDDGSRDGTAAAVREAALGRPRVRLLVHDQNQGYGRALRTGFEAGRFDHVAFTDADCQFHLADLAGLLPLADRFPVVAGFRVDRQDPWQRRFFSWGYNTLVRALLGTRVRDCDCALKVFRRDALTLILPETPGFFVNTEMLTRARQLGLGVAEVGVRHRPRLRGASKVSLLDIPRTLQALLPFWWSRVLFPGGCVGARERERAGARPASALGALALSLSHAFTLLLVAGLLFFGRLGAPLQEPDEARYAEVPRQMLAAGSLLVPVLHGEPYWDKPPLLYWLVMASYRTFGVHDWAARLVPGAAGLLVVLLTYFWGRRTLGPRAAFAGALVLALSARFVYLGRLLTPDGVLCLWVVAALAFAHLAVQGPRLRWGWWLLSALASGLGLLTKGPVALALAGVPLLALGALDPRTARPRGRGWAVYLAAALAVAGPWYVAAAWVEPTFAYHFFWVHNVVRFVAPFDHAKPAWFHLPGLLLGLLPWTLLLPGLVRFLLRRPAHAAARRPAALGFFLLACGWGVLFFALAGCKRATYVVPALPPLALALGCYLDATLPRRAWARFALLRGATRPAFGGTLLVLAVALAGSLAAAAAGLLAWGTAIVLAAGAVVALVLVYRHGRHRSPAASWALCGAATFAVLLAAVHLLLPGYARRFALRGPVRPQAELCADRRVPVVCYPRRWDSVSFYLGRDDVRVYTPAQSLELLAFLRREPGAVLVVKSDRYLDELLTDLPGSLEFVPQGRRGVVTVGLVRQRRTLPDAVFAER